MCGYLFWPDEIGVDWADYAHIGAWLEHQAPVLFAGADSGEVRPGRVVAFERSLPVAAALDPDTILAWEMEGAPLGPDHGYPVRLVVPRWYGVASVKWLERIEVLERPFEGYYQKETYVYLQDPLEEDGAPVTTMRVRSVIARPAEGETLPPGTVEIAGTAWSGESEDSEEIDFEVPRVVMKRFRRQKYRCSCGG